LNKAKEEEELGVNCPYCKEEMEWGNGMGKSGNGSESRIVLYALWKEEKGNVYDETGRFSRWDCLRWSSYDKVSFYKSCLSYM